MKTCDLRQLLLETLGEVRRYGIPIPTVHFGPGVIAELPGAVRSSGYDTVVVVTDRALIATPVMDRVLAVFATAGIETIMFDEVQPNPTTTNVADGASVVRLAASGGPVAVVAVGGGSAIDAATAITLAARPQNDRPPSPLFVVVTTAGTGAETNAFAVITDPATGGKIYLDGSLPTEVILDPLLTVSLPTRATAATGMDALIHALESLMSIRANRISNRIALTVIPRIMAYLPRAVADGSDREARANMLVASHLAGAGMASTGLGICHAIGHALAPFNIAHGEALTVVLEGILRFNLPVCTESLAQLALACGVGNVSWSDQQNASAVTAAITGLPDEIGMYRRLRDFEVTSGDFGSIAAAALADAVLHNTPRQPTTADIEAILTEAI